MTKEEFIRILGPENVVSEEQDKEWEQAVMEGKLACFGGPTKESEEFMKNPVKTPISQETIDNLKRRYGFM